MSRQHTAWGWRSPFKGLVGNAFQRVDAAELLHERYRIGARLGRSAVSAVFAGVDMRTGSPVAVKFIPLPANASLSDAAEWRARLRRETRTARQLRHAGIVALLDAGVAGGQAWLVMERVNGLDLSRYTQAQRRLPDPLALRVGVRLASALAHAHGRGVVHRDIKPANVLLDLASGSLKLADFGLARTDRGQAITRTGMTLGTPAYMAPELLAGQAATPASDTYALGVLLYELLSGRRPHAADSLGQLLHVVANEPIHPLAALRPDLPSSVVRLVERLLAVQPQGRPTDLRAWSSEMAALVHIMHRLISPDVPLNL